MKGHLNSRNYKFSVKSLWLWSIQGSAEKLLSVSREKVIRKDGESLKNWKKKMIEKLKRR